jgi:hypothetical protein
LAVLVVVCPLQRDVEVGVDTCVEVPGGVSG